MFKNLFKGFKVQLLTEAQESYAQSSLRKGKITQEELETLKELVPQDKAKKNLYLDWVVKQYLNRTSEDSDWDVYYPPASTINQYLTKYDNYVSMGLITGAQTDIMNAFPDIDTLGTLVNDIEDSGKVEKYEKNRETAQKVKEGSETIYMQYKCENCGATLDSDTLGGHSCQNRQYNPEAAEATAKKSAEKMAAWEKSTREKMTAEGASEQEIEARIIKAKKSSGKEKKGSSETYNIEQLKSLGLIVPRIEVIDLKNPTATQKYCYQATWCITDAEIFENYYKNIGCKFYLVVNHTFKPSSPCNKIVVVVFPREYKAMHLAVGDSIFGQVKGQKAKLSAADPDFAEYFDKLEDYMDKFNDLVDKKDETLYIVFTSDDKIMSFTTFVNLFKVPRSAFPIPPYKQINAGQAREADKKYAEDSKVLLKTYSIDESNKIKKEEEESDRGDMKVIAELLDNMPAEDPNEPSKTLEMGYLVTYVAHSKNKLAYVGEERLDTNKYCDVADLRPYKELDFRLLGGMLEDEHFKVYMATNPPRRHHNYFFLIPRNNDSKFFFLRYLEGEDYMKNQFREVFSYIDAVYVDKVVDDKMAYYCKQQQD